MWGVIILGEMYLIPRSSAPACGDFHYQANKRPNQHLSQRHNIVDFVKIGDTYVAKQESCAYISSLQNKPEASIYNDKALPVHNRRTGVFIDSIQ